MYHQDMYHHDMYHTILHHWKILIPSYCWTFVTNFQLYNSPTLLLLGRYRRSTSASCNQVLVLCSKYKPFSFYTQSRNQWILVDYKMMYISIWLLVLLFALLSRFLFQFSFVFCGSCIYFIAIFNIWSDLICTRLGFVWWLTNILTFFIHHYDL